MKKKLDSTELLPYSEAVKPAAQKLANSGEAGSTFEALNSRGEPTLYYLTNLLHSSNRHMLPTHISLKTGTGVKDIFVQNQTRPLQQTAA